MADEENNVSQQVAPQDDSAQIEQVAPTETDAQSPDESNAASDTEDLILGKFKSTEDLAHAYEEAQRKITEISQSRPAQENQPVIPPFPQIPLIPAQPFDESTQGSLDAWYAAKREQEKISDFTTKHAEELKDPVLDGTVRRLLAEARDNRTYLDQEDALAQAKDLLDKRLNGQVKEASKDALAEGQELARRKAQAGAVGETTIKAPVKDESQMSAKEWAEANGISRAN